LNRFKAKSALIAADLGINDQEFGHCDLYGIHCGVNLIREPQPFNTVVQHAPYAMKDAKPQIGYDNEGNYPCWRKRNSPLFHHNGRLQAVATHLRQAHDLLPAVSAHVRRHSRYPNYSTPQDQPLFERLLGDGSELGLTFSFASQDSPRGLADAFIIGRNFIGADRVALILGDNIFHGHGLTEHLLRASARKTGASVFGYRSMRRSERRVEL
jgi:hypothetical protein